MLAYRPGFSLLLAIASALGVLTAARTTAWGMDFQPVSADELMMADEPNAPGAAAIILFREVDRDDGSFHEDVYFRIKILTEEGRKYGDVEIPYLNGEIKITKLHARSIRPDGLITNFEGDVFEKTIVKARGIKYRAKTFSLSNVVVGGIIECLYTIEFSQHLVFDSHWILNEELFTKSAKFSLRPAMYAVGHLHIQWHNLPPGVQPVVTPNHIVELEIENFPAFQVEDFMPPENELKARVDFVYSQWNANNPEQFWNAFGKQCNQLLEDFIGKPNAMQEAVAGIVSAGDSPEVKLQKIYARVQQLRNLSFEEDKTWQEQKRDKEKFPKSAEEVWKLQRGSGVQLTWLFVGLARAAGIETYGVWVSERSVFFFTPESMDSYRLDTNVALAKLDGKDLYLDPGSAFIPFGMLPWSETGVSGYKLDKNGGGWVKTTLPGSSQSKITRNAQLKLTDTGDLEGRLTVTFSGLESSRRRVEERFADDSERKQFLEAEVKESIPVPCEVELTSQPDWKSSSPSMVAEFAVNIRGWASATGRRLTMPVGLFGGAEKGLFDQDRREHPIYIQYPFQRVDDTTIEMPSGWEILNLPPSEKNDKHLLVYGFRAEKENALVHLNQTLALEFMLLQTSSFPALRDFFRAVRTADEQQIVLQPTIAKVSPETPN